MVLILLDHDPSLVSCVLVLLLSWRTNRIPYAVPSLHAGSPGKGSSLGSKLSCCMLLAVWWPNDKKNRENGCFV